MEYTYVPSGVCSRMITFEVENEIVSNVKFIGGCNGNLKGLASLAEGMNIHDVIEKLEGIKCGMKQTSCPDQFSQALKQAL
ncbi:MAG: TIGR03905 family TSCPD domain-containing protein [Oscillospiraceae bacterium]|nr:TIGR03905 family TSCPD domain-containing protein [Oscillospiraceae bacterium]